ncbi:hypothetical protein [Vibrio astriarenae]
MTRAAGDAMRLSPLMVKKKGVRADSQSARTLAITILQKVKI